MPRSRKVDRAEAIRLRGAGWSVVQIAHHFGASTMAVYRWLKVPDEAMILCRCGKEFAPGNGHYRFCSTKCSQRFWRADNGMIPSDEQRQQRHERRQKVEQSWRDIIAAYEAGESGMKIATRLGITRHRVHQIIAAARAS